MHRRTFLSLAVTAILSLGIAACGGTEQAASQGSETPSQASSVAETSPLQQPGWFDYDPTNNEVTLSIRAGATGANNNWNFNGYHSGNATIVVPQGSRVTVEFHNVDQVNAHSFSIESQVGDYPPTFMEADAVFQGAHTRSPLQMANATQPGQSETVTFTASEAGNYAMVCLVPAHAAQGMWVHFNVSADGSAGVRSGDGGSP